jgi:hypothetical protein
MSSSTTPCIDGHACRRCWSKLSNIGSLFYFYTKYTPVLTPVILYKTIQYQFSCTEICMDWYGLVDRRSRFQTREHTQNLAKNKCRNTISSSKQNLITVNMVKLYKVQTSPDSYPTYSTTTNTAKHTEIQVDALQFWQLGMAP